MDVAPAALAREIGVIRGRDEADRLGRPREHVADVVRHALQLVRTNTDLVVHDVVVRRARRALKSYCDRFE